MNDLSFGRWHRPLGRFRPFRRRARPAPPPPAIGLYAHPGWLRRHRRLCFAALILFAIFYGFAFAIFARVFFVQLVALLAPLVALVVWVLPETRAAPDRLLGRLLTAFLVALLCWPDYLALALPGLPWISAIRIVGFPLVFVLLICVSVSAAFRAKAKDILAAAPWIWKLLVLFDVLALFSIAMSHELGNSINKFLIAQMAWIAVFFASVYVFAEPGRVRRFAYLLWGVVIFVCAIGVYEMHYLKLPWAGHIPWFLQVDDERIQNILNGRYRAGDYRVTGKSTTPLGMGELLGMATPFILHLMMTARRMRIIVAGSLTLPVVFWVVMGTGSRLAAICFFMSVLFYILVWGAMRWRDRKDSLFGPATVLGYPAIFMGFIAMTFVSGRLHEMVWGGGAQQASTDARKVMYRTGIPKVVHNPIGHGIGEGAITLGFYNPAGVLTIDTYYLAVALEYGVLGFLAYYGMICVAIFIAAKTSVQTRDAEVLMLAPCCVALINFMISKSVFSQQENHSLMFIMLGIVTALVWRHRQTAAKRPAVHRFAPIRVAHAGAG